MKRILLKVSGEALKGKEPFGIDQKACLHLAEIIKNAALLNLETAIVLGAGNIFRGIHLEELGVERTPADHMGMLGTLINGIALKQALLRVGVHAKVMSALACAQIVEPYHWEAANRFLEKGEVLIFVGGTGNPYFTTDTAAALRASEIKADILLKATKVAGVYDKDPLSYPDAKRYPTISYSDYLAKNLQVMDGTAISLCMESQIPIFVFDMQALNQYNLKEVISQTQLGTLIKG